MSHPIRKDSVDHRYAARIAAQCGIDFVLRQLGRCSMPVSGRNSVGIHLVDPPAPLVRCHSPFIPAARRNRGGLMHTERWSVRD
jgi:hypothetical protein